MKCFRTPDGHWFHGFDPSVGELLAISESTGFAAIRLVVTLLDKHVILGESDYDVVSVGSLEEGPLRAMIDGYMGRSVEVQSDGRCHTPGQSILAAIMAARDAVRRG